MEQTNEKEHHPRLHKEWEESWDAVMNQRATKERPIEKPLPIINRRTDERTEYKKRSLKGEASSQINGIGIYAEAFIRSVDL